MSDEKVERSDSPPDQEQLKTGEISDDNEALEVFKKDGAVNFRNVGWMRCTGIFLKVLFATGVLSIPTAMVSLGAVGGAFVVLASGLLNTYNGKVGQLRGFGLGEGVADDARRSREIFAIAIVDATPLPTWLSVSEGWCCARLSAREY